MTTTHLGVRRFFSLAAAAALCLPGCNGKRALPCEPGTTCLRVTPEGRVDSAGTSIAQCRGTFPDYIVDASLFPPKYEGPWFELTQDFPRERPAAGDLPWADIDFKAGKKEADAYLYALRDYAFDGMVEADFDPARNEKRRWYHVPLMNYHNGRELVRGVTEERPLEKGELGLRPDAKVRNFAVGFYNDVGAYTIGQVLARPYDPDLARARFDEGAMVFKILFSAARPEDFVDPAGYILEGAPAWQIAAGEKDGATTRLTTVRLLQMDVAVRDERAQPSGWVFGTFAFDRETTDESAWRRLRPVGVMWGNDPGYTPADQQAGKPLRESVVSDEIPDYAAGHLGWAGRVNGPVDNPISACLSCHQVAQYPVAADMAPFARACDTGDAVAKKLHWFRNLAPGEAFGAVNRDTCEPETPEESPVSLDFSLQLALAVQAMESRQNVIPCSPPEGLREGAPVSPAEEPWVER